jgi:hydroxyethylthiazole kinase-like sugar kinase family protein
MHEDLDFNITALLGCVIGAVCGYHLGTVQQAVFGAFVGFFASIVCAAIIAELAFAMGSVTAFGSRLLERLMPLLTLGLLLLVATRLWA